MSSMKFLLGACALVLAQLSHAGISAKSYAVVDDTGKVLLEHNSSDVRSIASITKLFSLAWITPSERVITITDDERDRLKGTRLRLKGEYSESQLMGVALSASNNEAAKAIGRANWASISMTQVRFPGIQIVEPSGLDPANRATALDLAQAARQLVDLPVAQETLKPTVNVGSLRFKNTNPLLEKRGWDFRVAKTGYIRESGGCLVAVVNIAGRDYSFAILGSSDTKQRWRDLALLRRQISDEPFEEISSKRVKKVRR